MNSSLQHRILDRLEEAPSAPALLHYSEPDAGDWLSREELCGAAAGSAERLLAAGLEPGRICLLVMPSGDAVAPILLGALLAGATPLLLAPPTFWRSNPDLEGFLAGVLGRTAASIVVRPEPLAGLGESHSAAVRFVTPSEVVGLADPSSLRHQATAGKGPAALQMTSGTTSVPRICAWSQRAVLATLDAMAHALRVDRDTVFFNWTPLYHDLGLVNNFLFCLVHGIPLAMMSPLDFVRQPASWLRGLSATRATTTWSPNFGFSLAAHRVKERDLEGVRLDRVSGFWNAAEKIHARTMRDFERRFEPFGLSAGALKASYGCAENVGGATFSAPDEGLVVEAVDRQKLFTQRIAVTGGDGPTLPIVGVGRPVAGLKVHILSEADEELPDGRVGEITLSGPSRMEGYLGESAATHETFAGTRLRTGDLGYQREDQLFWVGRVRERITVRGQKLDPSAFEPILLDIEGLREGCFAAFGIDDAERGTQRLVIVAEVRSPSARAPVDLVGDIRREIFRRLEVQPDDVVLVPPGSLGKTSSGKRRHRHFQRLYQAGGLDSLRLAGETQDG